MIKRLVILQDEQLVFAEIERSMRRAVGAPIAAPVAAMAAARRRRRCAVRLRDAGRGADLRRRPTPARG